MVCGLYPVGVHGIAILPGPWPVGRRKRSSAARSGSSARRPSARPSARRKRLQYVFGGLLAVAAVGGIVAVLALGVLGGDDSSRGPSGPKRRRHASGRSCPQQKTGDLKAAAKAAGCTLDNPRDRGLRRTRTRTSRRRTTRRTRRPPATTTRTGTRTGSTTPGDTPRLGMLVHPLEHGRIEVQYKEGTSADDVCQARGVPRARPTATTCCCSRTRPAMDAAVAATAWGHSLELPRDRTTGRGTRCGPSARPTSTRAPSPSPRRRARAEARARRARRAARSPAAPGPRAGRSAAAPAVRPFSSSGWRTVVRPRAGPRRGCRRSRRTRGPRGRDAGARPRIAPSAIWSVAQSTAVMPGSRASSARRPAAPVLARVERRAPRLTTSSHGDAGGLEAVAPAGEPRGGDGVGRGGLALGVSGAGVVVVGVRKETTPMRRWPSAARCSAASARAAAVVDADEAVLARRGSSTTTSGRRRSTRGLDLRVVARAASRRQKRVDDGLADGRDHVAPRARPGEPGEQQERAAPASSVGARRSPAGTARRRGR